MIKPQIPTGFWELPLDKQMLFNEMIKIVQDTYERNAFMQIDTPVMEYKEVLLAKSQGETSKQIFEVLKGDKAYVLRYDLTVPLSRFVAEHYNEIKFPFKRYQIGKVYRGERPQRGRYREFYQADVDIIGNDKLSINYDAYVIATISEALSKLGLSKYKVHINNRKMIQGLMEYLSVENSNDLCILIDKYDKLTKSQFESELRGLVTEQQAEELLSVLNITDISVMSLRNLNINNELFQTGICELEQVLQMLKILGVPMDRYMINLRIIRGLDYYTGTIFETFIEGYEQYGSISSGGRYANLANAYINRDLPGVGGSIGVSRLFSILDDIGFFKENKAFLERGVEYLIVPIGEEVEAFAAEVLQKIKQDDAKANIYFEKVKPDKAIKYCIGCNIPNIIFVGEEEVNRRTVKVKNLESRQESILIL